MRKERRAVLMTGIMSGSRVHGISDVVYLAHFNVVVDGGDVERTAAVVVDDVRSADGRRRIAVLLALSQNPQDEVLTAGCDGLVERYVSFSAPHPQIRLVLR